MYAVTYRKSPLPKTDGNMGVKRFSKSVKVASSSLTCVLARVARFSYGYLRNVKLVITFLTLRKRDKGCLKCFIWLLVGDMRHPDRSAESLGHVLDPRAKGEWSSVYHFSCL